MARWPWTQWPDARGTGGRITVESVARCSWNGWPDGRGIRTMTKKSSSSVLIAQRSGEKCMS
ncbi:MAG: hypothetical protein E6Q69_03415 [Aquipseudomonas alcaligenes]|uniref:Uncharacterized protein n=1 Tax=Aquipseudomonas alcaligenes TaxID=43263 RepID=A0A5C7WAU2_AQUAC|nr:MAG: hypothetical protein E6Q69_03415 [Pseudomonas alcaligenes]